MEPCLRTTTKKSCNGGNSGVGGEAPDAKAEIIVSPGQPGMHNAILSKRPGTRRQNLTILFSLTQNPALKLASCRCTPP